jgi:hypothetical protein
MKVLACWIVAGYAASIEACPSAAESGGRLRVPGTGSHEGLRVRFILHEKKQVIAKR